jgi:hypothetical protein
VPYDNNIGLRSVFPVDGSGPKGLAAAFDGLGVHVKNPHDKRARMVVSPVLPPLLAERGWLIEFTSRGGNAFALAPGAGRDVVMRLKPGKKFTANDVRGTRNRAIAIEVFADDILVGGFSFVLDPQRAEPAKT